jgi:hypothetical protein
MCIVSPTPCYLYWTYLLLLSLVEVRVPNRVLWNVKVKMLKILSKMPNLNNVSISEKTCKCTPTEDAKFDRTSLCSKRCCYLWRKLSANMDIAISIQCYLPRLSYIELYLRQTQQYTNEISHKTYILEFIGKIVQLCYMFRLIEPSSGATLRDFIGVLLCLTEIKLNIWYWYTTGYIP